MTTYFAKSGLLYSASNMIFAILNAVFWLIAVKFIDSKEIGLASAAFSLPVLFTSIAVLSIEYPLLKYISKDKSYFASILFFEILIHLLLLPIFWIVFQRISNDFLLFVFATVILFCIPVRAITGFALMGSFSIRPVVVIDIISAGLKISLLVLIAALKMESIGIMIAISSQFIVSSVVLAAISFKKFGFHLKLKSLKITLLEGLVNFPTKFSAVVQYFGTISILALYEIPQEDIAGFTVSYGFFVFISAIPAGLALLAIPSSVKQNTDLSSQSTKWSMALSIPIICILIISPHMILRIYNESYTKYDDLLVILSISILPFILKSNIVTMLNNQSSLKKVTVLGIVESGIFLSIIIILIPSSGVIGSTLAIAFASVGSVIISLYWANNAIRKIFFLSILILLTGIVSGYIVEQILNDSFMTLLSGFGISILSLFLFRLIRFSEILPIISQIRQRI